MLSLQNVRHILSCLVDIERTYLELSTKQLRSYRSKLFTARVYPLREKNRDVDRTTLFSSVISVRCTGSSRCGGIKGDRHSFSRTIPAASRRRSLIQSGRRCRRSLGPTRLFIGAHPPPACADSARIHASDHTRRPAYRVQRVSAYTADRTVVYVVPLRRHTSLHRYI